MTLIKFNRTIRYMADAYSFANGENGKTKDVPHHIAASLIAGGDAALVDSDTKNTPPENKGLDLTEIKHIGEKSAEILTGAGIALKDVAEPTKETRAALIALRGVTKKNLGEVISSAKALLNA